MKIHHPPSTARDAETQRREENTMLRLFRPRKYRGQNKRNPSWRRIRGGGDQDSEISSSFSLSYSKRGCGNYGCRYSGSRNSRNIFGSARSSLCLGVSSEAGGEVLFCLAVVGNRKLANRGVDFLSFGWILCCVNKFS
jgi:hypothetical protein